MAVSPCDKTISETDALYAEFFESAENLLNPPIKKDVTANETMDFIFSDVSPKSEAFEEIVDKWDHTYAVEKKRRCEYHPISDELRKKIIDSMENCLCSRRVAATTFNVPYSSVQRIYQQFLAHARVAKQKRILHKPNKLNAIQKQFLVEELSEDSKLTLTDLVEKVLKTYNVTVTTTTIRNYLKNFHYSIRRIQNEPLTATTPIKIQKCKIYSKQFLRLCNSYRCIIYFDEVEFEVTLRRLYGPVKPGIRTQKITPFLKTRNKTMMAAMTKKELFFHKVLPETGNRDSFMKFLHELFEVLQTREITNAIIITNNAIFHKYNEIAEFVQSAGHELQFLPPFSPFFNPIENMFQQWKTFVRSKSPNNETEFEEIIDTFSGVVTRADCESYCEHVVKNAKLCIDGQLVFKS